MELTIFAKKKTTKEDKKFYIFLTTLKKKDGTEQHMTVKFKEDCPELKASQCPCNIIVEKKDANVSERAYTDNEGNDKKALTLWIGKYQVGEPYVDTSLDDYEF